MSTDHLFWIEGLFYLTFTLSLLFFYLANGRSLKWLGIIMLGAAFHGILAHQGYYANTDAKAPPFALVLLPNTLFIILGLLPHNLRKLAAHRNRKWSTLSHSVRIGVELVLWGLFMEKLVPELMTFEGRNFDILAGVSAPIVALLYFRYWPSDRFLIAWNCLGLGLVLFILVNGVLSAELPFQQFAFDQPNKAVALFPFIWLPAVIVPLVIWTHLSDIFLLLQSKRQP